MELLTKSCKRCNKNFQPSNLSEQFCSDDCRERRYTLSCQNCSEAFEAATIVSYCPNCKVIEKACEKCGQAFTVDSTRIGRKFCSEQCETNRYTNTCEGCQQPFDSPHSNAKYCSEACKDKVLTLKYTKTCLVCREDFIGKSSNQLYCSNECRDIATEKSTKSYDLTCIVCEHEFVSNDPRTLTCSTQCNHISSKGFCLHCSDIFEKETREQVWCSDHCKAKMKVRYCKKCDRKFYSKINKSYCSDRCKMKQCKHCDKHFMPTNSPTFCSEACQTEHYTHTCRACNESFYKPVYHAKYCSIDCKNVVQSAKKYERVCRWCKKVITVLSENLNYCSETCMENYRKNKDKKDTKSEQELREVVEERVKVLLTRRNDLMKEQALNTVDYWTVDGFNEALKNKVLQRDNYHCYVCENDKDLEVHHVLPRRLGGSHEMDNLITLCVRCHRHVETGNYQHAVKKCLENAKKHFNMPSFKLSEKLTRKEQMSIIENEISKIYEKMIEHNNGEMEELLIEFDNFFDELNELKKVL